MGNNFKKYRVVKISDDFFIIQSLVKKTKGYLWWKKTYSEWAMCNIFGGEYFSSFYLRSPSILSFNTYEKSEKKMNEFIIRDLTKG